MLVARTFKRIKIQAKTPIAKPGNGVIRGGNTTNLLLAYNEQAEGKAGSRYMVKGLRGMLNHAMMALAQQQGIEVCHSSDKRETQAGVRLLPEGFHPNGSCFPENECIKHKIMGSIKKQSLIRFDSVIVVSDNLKGTFEDAQKIHIGTENRTSLMYKTKKSIQNFKDRYIGGRLIFTIELLGKLTKKELGFLLKGILYMPELRWGRGGNNGAGKLVLENIQLQKVRLERTIVKGKVQEETKVQNLWREMEEALQSW
ncbi:MAG: hypothetical protein DRP02_14805 [Candidatus Gerdarchaeota archaeon]|nr:MAG: hypothetical protein DRP02_14805 [Candidatus Gerdarchaeota archaeon]